MKTVILLSIFFLTACGVPSESEETLMGGDGQKCYPNQTCNKGLTCLNNLCTSGKKATSNTADGGVAEEGDSSIPGTSECKSGTMTCSDDNASLMCEAGKWVKQEDCDKAALKWVTFKCGKCGDTTFTDCFSNQPIITVKKLTVDGKSILQDLETYNLPKFVECRHAFGKAHHTNLTNMTDNRFIQEIETDTPTNIKMKLSTGSNYTSHGGGIVNPPKDYGTIWLTSVSVEMMVDNALLSMSSSTNVDPTRPTTVPDNNVLKIVQTCPEPGCEWSSSMKAYLRDTKKAWHFVEIETKGVITEEAAVK